MWCRWNWCIYCTWCRWHWLSRWCRSCRWSWCRWCMRCRWCKRYSRDVKDVDDAVWCRWHCCRWFRWCKEMEMLCRWSEKLNWAAVCWIVGKIPFAGASGIFRALKKHRKIWKHPWTAQKKNMMCFWYNCMQTLGCEIRGFPGPTTRLFFAWVTVTIFKDLDTVAYQSEEEKNWTESFLYR